MKYRLSATTLLAMFFVIVAGAILWQKPVDADILDSFDAERIISDTNFIDYGSVSTAQIQSFLNEKNSVCLKNFKALGLYDSNNDGLGDEPYGKGNGTKVSAATLIKQAANLYHISPKVILVTLQKEQGLITRTDCPQWRYNTALGYGCPDTAPCDNSAYGFTRQIDYGVWHFKGFFNDTNPVPPTVPGKKTIAYNPDSRCGGKEITIRNRATAALYSYTPYQPNNYALNGGSDSSYPKCGAFGNRNFFSYYTSWFGLPNSDSDSLFIRCSDDNEYLIESTESRKRLLSVQTQAYWGLAADDFLDIDYGCDYPTYDLELSNFVRSRNTGKAYLVDRGRAYEVVSDDQARAWSLGALDQTLPQVNGATLTSSLQLIRDLPRVVTSDNESRSDYYLIDNGTRYYISGTREGNQDSYRLVTGYDSVPSTTMSVNLLQTLPLSDAPLNYLLNVGGNIYALNHGSMKRVSLGSASIYTGAVTPLTLSAQVLSLISTDGVIADNILRDGVYYKLEGSEARNTLDASIANDWSIHPPIEITRLLRNKLLPSFALQTPEKSLSRSNNIRLISCSGDPYIVERDIRVKRGLASTGITAWRLTDKYFYLKDKGCSYPVYSAELGNVIRSRSTKKVYYLEDGKAKWVQSQSDASGLGINLNDNSIPQVDPESIKTNFTVTTYSS